MLLSGSAVPDRHEPTKKKQIVITYIKKNFVLSVVAAANNAAYDEDC